MTNQPQNTLTPKQQASLDKAWAAFIKASNEAKAAWDYYKTPGCGGIDTLQGNQAYRKARDLDKVANRARGVFHRVQARYGWPI